MTQVTPNTLLYFADSLKEAWYVAIQHGLHLLWMTFPFIAFFVEFLPLAYFWEKGIRSSSIPASALVLLAIPSILLWGEHVPSPLLLPMPGYWWLVPLFKAVDVLYVIFWWSVYWCLALSWYPYWLYWRGFLHPYYSERWFISFWDLHLGHPLSPYTLWKLWKEVWISNILWFLDQGYDWRKAVSGGAHAGIYRYYRSQPVSAVEQALKHWRSTCDRWVYLGDEWLEREAFSQRPGSTERKMVLWVDHRVASRRREVDILLQHLIQTQRGK